MGDEADGASEEVFSERLAGIAGRREPHDNDGRDGHGSGAAPQGSERTVGESDNQAAQAGRLTI